jgi:hypothetical protein
MLVAIDSTTSAPDDEEEAKGQPVVPTLDQRAYGGAGRPSDDRHQCLEKAKVPRQAKGLPPRCAAESDTDPDRDGESVHREAEGDSKKYDQIHLVPMGIGE